jgi:CheY-like chemotaxis protein
MAGDGVPFPGPARAARRTGSGGRPSRRVLIVDDDDAIRQLLGEILADAGYVVDQARGGREGLERVAAAAPDVILLDQLMPDGDGTMFATAYAKREPPHAPILAICASKDGEAWSKAIRAAAYVLKPFDIDDLLALVAQHARSGSATAS